MILLVTLALNFSIMKKQQIIVPIILLASVTLLASCGTTNTKLSPTPTSQTPVMQKDNSMMKDDGSMMKDEGVMVGGAMMIKSRDIVDNAVLASNVTTLVAAVKAAGLVETLKSPGPFTVFAPTNAAFAKLPAGTVDTLVKPENK